MRSHTRLAAAAAMLLCAAPAAAGGLLPHRASYTLSLDRSRSSGQLEEMNGRLDYEISGDACAGYETLTRQESTASTGDGSPIRQASTAKAWEDGAAKAYRFQATPDAADADAKVEANVERQADALKVVVSRPKPQTLDLKGEILLPTEHVRQVLAAGAAGERLLAAKVYEGTSDPAKVYDTLSVIGAPNTDESRIAAPARTALAGHTFYPVTVSYYEEDGAGKPPAYVMSFSLYDNGVVGGLKIDYGRFALVGAMSAFEALKAPGNCGK